MSNLAVEELVDERRQSGTVVSGLFDESVVRDNRENTAAELGARRWRGRTRLAIFVVAVLASWSLVFLAIYLLF